MAVVFESESDLVVFFDELGEALMDERTDPHLIEVGQAADPETLQLDHVTLTFDLASFDAAFKLAYGVRDATCESVGLAPERVKLTLK